MCRRPRVMADDIYLVIVRGDGIGLTTPKGRLRRRGTDVEANANFLLAHPGAPYSSVASLIGMGRGVPSGRTGTEGGAGYGGVSVLGFGC